LDTGAGDPDAGHRYSSSGIGAFIEDPLTGGQAEMRRIQPADARKEYVCPGCNQEIRRETGHVVIVPLSAPDLRRHWHNPCLARARQHGLH
jgi:hypothetical protein